MEEEILFCNKTKITRENFGFIIFFERFFCHKNTTIIKLSLCIFILIGTIFLQNEKLLHKGIYILTGIIGIIDIFKIKKPDTADVMIFRYQFFDEYFLLNKDKLELKFYYNDVRYLIDTKKYYFFVFSKSIAMIDKEGFSIGDEEEMKKFILGKRKKQA